MIAFLLAAASAFCWGTSDFAGGKASQKASPMVVALVTQLPALPAQILAVALIGAGRPDVASMCWGAAAGAVGIVGLVLFYDALAGGAMTVAAPISGLVGTVVPVVAGMILQGFPGWFVLSGAGLAVVAVGLVSVSAGGMTVTGRVIGGATVSGLLFGLAFVFVAQTSPRSGMWPTLSAWAGSTVMAAAVLLVTRTPIRLAGGSARPVIVCGVLAGAAALLYVSATHRGLLSVVAPVASLYPAVTVLLALLVDKERLRPAQLLGLTFAAAAMALVAS